VRLRDVTFVNWLRSHGEKNPEERWLRELYPWPVLAQVDCDGKRVGHQHLALQPLFLKPAQQLHLLFFIPAGAEDQELFR
jgi:hypothetical protein